MNKGERMQIRKRKWSKRLKQTNQTTMNRKFCDQGKPCSCDMCSPQHIKSKYKLSRDQLDEINDIYRDQDEGYDTFLETYRYCD